MAANYKIIALQVGDLIKYTTSFNEINRAAQSVCSFQLQEFPQYKISISSVRAYQYLCWVFTIASQSNLPLSKRNEILLQFSYLLLQKEQIGQANKVFEQAGILTECKEFDRRNFHSLIIKNSRELYRQSNYFHAVFESAKLYNKEVERRSGIKKDGSKLMMDAFGENGVLKHNKGITTSEVDELNGIKFLSAGLMQALRNPTAHELATEWDISKEDCLDILSLISFLLRKLDESQKII